MSIIKKFKRKNIILTGLIVLLLAVSCINYFYLDNTRTVGENDTDNPYNAQLVSGDLTEEEVMSGAGSVSSEFFAEYRLERERTRSENIETLQVISQSVESSSQSIENAQTEMIALVKLSEQELLLENLIKSKGFEDCVVFIHQGYVNILVDAKSITQQEAIQIQDIVAKECGIELSKISIAVTGN